MNQANETNKPTPRRFAMLLKFSLLAVFVLSGARAVRALAQEGHVHSTPSQNSNQAWNQNGQNALIQIVRESTERYQNVSAAEAAGYALQFGCVSGPDSGAMGMHFVNFPLVADGIIDVTRPEIVIYEPQPNGSLKLIGADYLVLADTWNATHSAPPQLMGQLFHYFESPNRFGLPAFYTLHVWAWKENPTGAFVNWHSNVSCEAFNGAK
jgi:hypothetical protein